MKKPVVFTLPTVVVRARQVQPVMQPLLLRCQTLISPYKHLQRVGTPHLQLACPCALRCMIVKAYVRGKGRGGEKGEQQ